MLKYKLKYKSIHIRTNINTFMKTSSDWASKFEREAAKMKSSLEKRWGEIRGKWEQVNIFDGDGDGNGYERDGGRSEESGRR